MSENRIFKLSELEFAEDLYPRARLGTWWPLVTRYVDEMKAGSSFPPITVGLLGDRKIVVDGWHRCEAYRKLKVEFVKAEVRRYSQERDLFADAGRLNSTHGAQITPRDKARIIDRLEEYRFTPGEIQSIVKATPDTFKALKARTVSTPRGKLYLKSPVNDLAKRNMITPEEGATISQEKLSIRRLEDLLAQLVNLLGSDAFPWHDPKLGVLFTRLYTLLKERYAPLAVTS